MSDAAKDVAPEDKEKSSSFQAAVARTMTRSMALYFSRPARLFRPTKVTGWNSLRAHAHQGGVSLTPKFLSDLVKKQGFLVIPKHFVPPMLVNAVLGSILWETYSTMSGVLEPTLYNPTLIAALSGGVAGGVQALAAAPTENVRLLLLGGSGHGWSHAWKEVFRGTEPPPAATKQQHIQEIRQLRKWMKDVGGMAGRGWGGWGWGCAKDICGFAAFFAVFDVTRRFASHTRDMSNMVVHNSWSAKGGAQAVNHHFPRAVHGFTLVSGGVIAGLVYEYVSRPWDHARQCVQQSRILVSTTNQSGLSAITNKLRNDGVVAFFRNPATIGSSSSDTSRRGLHGALRTLARVGPWGVGFLVWEAFGPGLS